MRILWICVPIFWMGNRGLFQHFFLDKICCVLCSIRDDTTNPTSGNDSVKYYATQNVSKLHVRNGVSNQHVRSTPNESRQPFAPCSVGFLSKTHIFRFWTVVICCRRFCCCCRCRFLTALAKRLVIHWVSQMWAKAFGPLNIKPTASEPTCFPSAQATWICGADRGIVPFGVRGD